MKIHKLFSLVFVLITANNDFYTSLDQTISAIDIKNIYGDFYPEF